MKVLEKNKGWMITGEIMSELGATRSTVNRATKKLLKEGVILRKEVLIRRGGPRSYLWKYKD